VRATTLAAGGLACAGAAMTIAAFAGGGHAEPEPATRAKRTGAEVFAMQGCGGCHAFKPANADGWFAPDLALSLHGEQRDDVMRSIVLPDADVAQGYSPGMMPSDFAQRIAPQDLEALVSYLMRGAAAPAPPRSPRR
jgi:mono/diheme cytochrome c family protein